MFSGGGAASTFETRRQVKITSSGISGPVAMHRCAHIGPGGVRCERTTMVRPLCPVHVHAMHRIMIDQQIDGNLGLYAYDPDDKTGRRIMFEAGDVVYYTDLPGESVSRAEINRRYGANPNIVSPYGVTYCDGKTIYDGLFLRDVIMFCNTGPDPNTEFVELESGCLALVAKRPVRNTQAITVDYGGGYITALQRGMIPKIEYDPPFGPLDDSLYGELSRDADALAAAARGLALRYLGIPDHPEARLAAEALSRVAEGKLDLGRLPGTLRSELLFYGVW